MIDSTQKQDVFRQEYAPISADMSAKILAIKQKAQELYDLIGTSGVLGTDFRCLAVSKTHLEESIMWAIKGLTAPEIQANQGQSIPGPGTSVTHS